jgi:hypothetical protein
MSNPNSYPPLQLNLSSDVELEHMRLLMSGGETPNEYATLLVTPAVMGGDLLPHGSGLRLHWIVDLPASVLQLPRSSILLASGDSSYMDTLRKKIPLGAKIALVVKRDALIPELQESLAAADAQQAKAGDL